ncbi:MAG: alanine racemase [Candidatus Magasanikbacteria bacterium]|nr:alanine racemase [Candidatus Magasanikbacteria bacterium]
MLSQLRQWFYRLKAPRRPYRSLVEIKISAGALRRNLAVFQIRYPNLAFAPVLKSNAYGHGLALAARILEALPIPFLVVDSYFEALLLRRAGIHTPLLIIGYASDEQLARPISNCAFTISSLDQLKRLAELQHQRLVIHLKIDTGMHRQGIAPAEAGEAMAILQRSPRLRLEGIASHLAQAETADDNFTSGQIAAWNNLAGEWRRAFPDLRYVHLSNTEGTRWSNQIDANLVRLGLGLYGYRLRPDSELGLTPALSLHTVVTAVKSVAAGAQVGYNTTFTAPRPMRLAILPLGYHEGIDRRLSNRGVVKIADRFCPIVGRVSMNITIIDVSAAPAVREGTPVTVISANPADLNSVTAIAEQCGTIPYEILVHLSPSLRRTVVD